MSDVTTNAPAQGSPTPAAAGQAGTPPTTPPAQAPAQPQAPGTVLTGEQAGAAPTDGAKADTTAQADFELKFPEGVEKDDALVSEFKKFAQELKLDGAAAQKSFEYHLKSRAAVLDAAKGRAAEAHLQRVKEWSAALQADKEFGGAAFDQNVVVAKKALTKFGSAEFTKFLNSTGLGSHPEMVKLLHRVGLAVSEDSAAGTTGTVTAKPQESAEEKLRGFYNKSPGLFKP